MSNPKIPSRTGDMLPKTAGSTDVDAFIAAARRVTRPPLGEGRLILALDATMSRQPTWDLACRLQGEMFDAVGKAGHLSVQLAYFRGFGECRASKFVADAGALKRLMERIDCRGGHTQIGKVLSHGLKETRRQKVQALVFIGDAMEEAVDDLAAKAGQLGLAGTPVFLFQEGHDPVAERAFREIARLSRGAWFRFDRTAASSLADLLSAIARYASGGLGHLGGSAR
jgi:hypothetical protein